LAVVTVYFGTSSSYLEADDSLEGQVTVNVTGSGVRTQAAWTTHDSDRVRVHGRPRFPDFLWYQLKFRVVDPPGQQADPFYIGLYRSAYLIVPKHLSDKKMRIFRVFPPGRIFTAIPDRNTNPTHTYELRIAVDGKPCEAIRDFRQEAVYFGSHAEKDIEWFVAREDPSDWDRAVEHIYGKPPRAKQIERAVHTNRRYHYVPSIGVKAKLVVKLVRLVPEAEGREKTEEEVARGEWEVSGATEIQLIRLEMVVNERNQ
jgi:hypothetical protein